MDDLPLLCTFSSLKGLQQVRNISETNRMGIVDAAQRIYQSLPPTIYVITNKKSNYETEKSVGNLECVYVL